MVQTDLYSRLCDPDHVLTAYTAVLGRGDGARVFYGGDVNAAAYALSRRLRSGRYQLAASPGGGHAPAGHAEQTGQVDDAVVQQALVTLLLPLLPNAGSRRDPPRAAVDQVARLVERGLDRLTVIDLDDCVTSGCVPAVQARLARVVTDRRVLALLAAILRRDGGGSLTDGPLALVCEAVVHEATDGTLEQLALVGRSGELVRAAGVRLGHRLVLLSDGSASAVAMADAANDRIRRGLAAVGCNTAAARAVSSYLVAGNGPVRLFDHDLGPPDRDGRVQVRSVAATTAGAAGRSPRLRRFKIGPPMIVRTLVGSAVAGGARLAFVAVAPLRKAHSIQVRWADVVAAARSTQREVVRRQTDAVIAAAALAALAIFVVLVSESVTRAPTKITRSR